MNIKTQISPVWVLASIAILTSCAEERDPIDRVQPYAIDKAFFLGENFTDPSDDPEFYARNHVVDVGYGAAQDSLMSAAYSPVGRIRWQISENFLIGRSAYERIVGSDGKGSGTNSSVGNAVGKTTPDGIIVCMFAIDSHFDIVRSYNPTTGEKLNVVEENNQDRPWYERRYMRVDWSQNLNTDSYDFDTLSLAGILGGVKYEPVSYFVENPADKEAPLLDFENGYFDVTTKAFAQPAVVDLSALGWGIDKFPACFLNNDFYSGSAPTGNCNPVEITLRHSFKRIEPSDYEPRAIDGPRFSSYGGFYTERLGYDRNYGVTDDKWHRMLNRYNIWERSHYYKDPAKMTGWIPCNTEDKTPVGADPNRDSDGNGTEDECQAVFDATGTHGSRCDVFKQRCTLPYQLRKAKPIPWFYTDTSNPDYFEPSARAAHEWDIALRSAIQTAKYAECVRTGGTECKQKYPMWNGQMYEQQDALQLALEVDDCRSGKNLAKVKQVINWDKNKWPDICNQLAYDLGTRRNVSKEVMHIATMPEMIALCHSPVLADDPEICGPNRLPRGVQDAHCIKARKLLQGELASDASISQLIESSDEIEDLASLVQTCDSTPKARHGDLRYHVINVIQNPQDPSPWGMMASAVDPLTGETIATDCNVWSSVTDEASQMLVDQIRLIKGEIDAQSLLGAENVQAYEEAASAAAGNGALGTYSRETISSKVSELLTGKNDPDFIKEMSLNANSQDEPQADIKADIELVRDRLRGLRANAKVSNSMSAVYNARRSAARGTEFEAQLMTDAVRRANGVQGMELTDSVMDLASPLRGGNPTLKHNLDLAVQNGLAQRHTCVLDSDHAAQAPMALSPLADIVEKKFEGLYGPFDKTDSSEKQLIRAEAIRRYLAQKIHFGVVTHEMGHSISHRHNFVASADAWSYWPQYWQLRTVDGTVNDECTGKEQSGENCVGPRFFDPITANEKNNLIHMFMNSSVMDYPGDITQDMLGAGIYDFAATRLFYGDVVSVLDDSVMVDDKQERLEEGTVRADGIIDKLSSGFGGILGIEYSNGISSIHYSKLQRDYQLIKPDTCQPVELANYIPLRYDSETNGAWHPVLDGLIVTPDGGKTYTRCKQNKVDYVNWSELKLPDGNLEYYYAWGAFDAKNRVLAPYAFGTDSWVDLGNANVYRHDSGADVYEIFNYLITQKEVSHIFADYRRGRTDFSLRSAANRGLTRYDIKLKDGVKGLSLYRNIIADIAFERKISSDRYWPKYINGMGESILPNIVAAGLVFDYFARELARPESGPHLKIEGDPVLRSSKSNGQPRGDLAVTIPNGARGMWGQVTPGGALLESDLADGLGDFDVEYTMNCGSYYDKMNVSMLLTESVDNYISSSRQDSYDARYRSHSLADLFPEGFRRLLGNALTGDDFIKGPRIPAEADGTPKVDVNNFVDGPIGWTSWWGEVPEHCFPTANNTVCRDFAELSNDVTRSDSFSNQAPAYVTAVDPQIGWEQQKFLIAWTMLFLPANQKQNWLDQLMVWELGRDEDPGFENRIEFHYPDGRVYVAHTFGRETIFGKTVQKSIAARVLEYANSLLAKAYATTPVDRDGDGTIDWYEPLLGPNGEALVLYDPQMAAGVLDASTCNSETNTGCTCTDNLACIELKDYVSVPAFMRQAIHAYRLAYPTPKGLF